MGRGAASIESAATIAPPLGPEVTQNLVTHEQPTPTATVQLPEAPNPETQQPETASVYTHTLPDGRTFAGTLEQARKLCPVIGAMSTEKAQATLAQEELAERVAARGRAKREAKEARDKVDAAHTESEAKVSVVVEEKEEAPSSPAHTEPPRKQELAVEKVLKVDAIMAVSPYDVAVAETKEPMPPEIGLVVELVQARDVAELVRQAAIEVGYKKPASEIVDEPHLIERVEPVVNDTAQLPPRGNATIAETAAAIDIVELVEPNFFEATVENYGESRKPKDESLDVASVINSLHLLLVELVDVGQVEVEVEIEDEDEDASFERIDNLFMAPEQTTSVFVEHDANATDAMMFVEGLTDELPELPTLPVVTNETDIASLSIIIMNEQVMEALEVFESDEQLAKIDGIFSEMIVAIEEVEKSVKSENTEWIEEQFNGICEDFLESLKDGYSEEIVENFIRRIERLRTQQVIENLSIAAGIAADEGTHEIKRDELYREQNPMRRVARVSQWQTNRHEWLGRSALRERTVAIAA